MRKGEVLKERLRYQILGLMHAGHLRPGDRLPSIRQVAEREEVDHRAVSRAYRELADEGLVEIRPGSGVYIAGNRLADGVLSETVSWLADLLMEGWRRRFGRAEVGDLVARCASTPLRCACIESNQDHMAALCGEIEEDFSLEVMPVLVGSQPGAGAPDPERIRAADIVVTSVFHADAVRRAAEQADRPLALLTFNEEFTAEIDRRLRATPLTVVVADPGFVARGEAYLAVTHHQGRVRYVLVDRLEEEGVDPTDPEVLVTRAARRRLGMEDYHLLPAPLRVISTQSARELCWTIVQTTLQRAERLMRNPREA